MKYKGFTIIELTVVIAALSILFGLVSVNLLTVRGKADLNTTYNTVVSDLRTQQLKAMVGESEESDEGYGVYFLQNSYVLFQGGNYDSNDPANFEVDLPENLEFAENTLPNSQVVFIKGSGELSAYSPSQSSIKLRSSLNDQEKTFSLNRRGVVFEQ